jgi:uncharacterized protein DUF3108
MISCGKENVGSQVKVKSSVMPLQIGNYWKYKFHRRLTDSTYNATAGMAEMKVLKTAQMPDGRDAVVMTLSADDTFYVDTIYLANKGTDLVFYNNFYNETLRLKEPLEVNKVWKYDSLAYDTEITTVVKKEAINTPVGTFDSYKITHITNPPPCSCQWRAIYNNVFWMKEGIGIVKQDVLVTSTGFPGLPGADVKLGLFELIEFKLN